MIIILYELGNWKYYAYQHINFKSDNNYSIDLTNESSGVILSKGLDLLTIHFVLIVIDIWKPFSLSCFAPTIRLLMICRTFKYFTQSLHSYLPLMLVSLMLTLDEEPNLVILISILSATIFSTSLLVLFSDSGPKVLRMFHVKLFDWKLERREVDMI